MYSAGDLPSASYAKTVPAATTSGGKREVTLEVSWIDAGSQDTALAGYGGWTTLTRHGATASARDVLAAVPAGGYGVVLTESVEYFRA